jgi:hypothetical protein
MTSFRLRPRFQHHAPYTPEEIKAMVSQKLAAASCGCIGSVNDGYITLRVPLGERHYWSPQLNLSLEAEEGGTRIRGLYGPNPTVWAMFFFAYAAIGTLSLFIAIIGFSQKALGMEAPVLWALPVLGSLALVLYITAQMGQKAGVAQTFALHHFYEDVIQNKVHIM